MNHIFHQYIPIPSAHFHSFRGERSLLGISDLVQYRFNSLLLPGFDIGIHWG
jgi:hypothetical protein